MTINKVSGQSTQASTEVSSETQATTGSPSDSHVTEFNAALDGLPPELQGLGSKDADAMAEMQAEVQKYRQATEEAHQQLEYAKHAPLALDSTVGSTVGSQYATVDSQYASQQYFGGDLIGGTDASPPPFDPTSIGGTFDPSSFDSTSFDPESLRQEAEASRKELEASFKENKGKSQGG